MTQEIKILGLIFDSKLSWKPHLENLKKDCLLKINLIKTLAAKKWGAKQQVLCNTYKALIQSKLDYGCVVYDLVKNNVPTKLERILNTSMRIAIGAFFTSPTISILSKSNSIPLSLRLKELSP